MSNMSQVRFEFVLSAESPIAHHEAVFGNTAVIARRKVRKNGEWFNVPIVSADAMRHGLREASAYAFLDAAGLLSESLTEEALRLLFAGGQVTGSAGGGVKMNEYHEMCELVPMLSLLGGCAQNRVVPGRIWADDAVLICEEAKIPEWALEVAKPVESLRQHVEEVQRVRMDPMLDPAKHTMLTAGERERVNLRLLRSETASEMKDAPAKDENKSTMMPRSFERIAQGSLFYWSVTATTYSEIEADTFITMCAAFLADARVGGKRGTGHGLLKPIAGRNVTLSSPSERIETIKPDSLSTARVGSLFRAHVAERSERIKAFLSKVAA